MFCVLFLQKHAFSNGGLLRNLCFVLKLTSSPCSSDRHCPLSAPFVGKKKNSHRISKKDDLLLGSHLAHLVSHH